MSKKPGLADLGLKTCLPPFLDESLFQNSTGYIDGRFCASLGDVSCCLPCPMTDFVYPESFNTLGTVAGWVGVVSLICAVFLLASYAVLPVEKTHRHYLSICLTCAVAILSLGFVIPLAGNPPQCADKITPNSMKSNSVCAASGASVILGGFSAVMWVFLRSLSLHLQICWQVVVGRNFMWASQALGWGIPILGLTLDLVFSGVSFRFGNTCHINHENSLADLWIPLLVLAGLTIIIQFATFGYCIKVYLASLADNSASTEGSGMPSYTNSIRTMTPRQAYRRVRRVIQLQWRGIAIVILIIADVIFFSIIFVFQDNTVQSVKANPDSALDFLMCLIRNANAKDKCLNEAKVLVVNQATVGAVLLLLAMNGLWLVLFFGRWTMVTGWIDMFRKGPERKEFVSVDARLDDLKKDPRSYEMLSRDTGKNMEDDVVTPPAVSPLASAMRSQPMSPSGRRTPDYFGQTARYHTPARSFSSPRPPQQVSWENQTYARGDGNDYDHMNPLGMNRI
ncbi:uncharacterized protein E0L32_001042 [Thyridium curvatum]|uniref:G-protein coupled receptors family 2 profile 2 domain-containing protein n=1 Tax=Thyridium curvatum TaxID=1093900 RepID=A0A507AXP7_9PEZI|nr:uncharacterized protein E0L32_001042 [Thyridium curvatum]TPX11224.1 hypothetical protein E0L32_001042 [Thyridium curvatum]